MIYKTLNSKRIAGIIIIPVMVVLFWSIQLFQPVGYPFYEGENQMPLFAGLCKIVGDWPLISVILGLILLIISGLLIQRINNEYVFFRIKTMLPTSIFLLIVCGFKQFHTLHPVYFGIIFLILALYRLFSAFELRKPLSQAFDAGFLLGLGSLFYLNLMLFLPALIIGVVMLGKESNWREVAISLIGALVPWILTFAGYFLLDDVTVLLNSIINNFLTYNKTLPDSIVMYAYVGFLLLLIFIGSLFILRKYDEKKVNLRQYYMIFFFVFVTAVLSAALVPSGSWELFLIAAVPVSFLISDMLIAIGKRFVGEIVIFLFIAFNVAVSLFG